MAARMRPQPPAPPPRRSSTRPKPGSPGDGRSQARAGEAEINAISGYAVVRAPFAGTVTQRFVDPGAFAARGAARHGAGQQHAAHCGDSCPEVAAGVKRGTPRSR
jgi:hypothetical protein